MHTTHIEHLPHMGKYMVYCDQGCNLGTSAIVDTLDQAVTRAELHTIAEHELWFGTADKPIL